MKSLTVALLLTGALLRATACFSAPAQTPAANPAPLAAEAAGPVDPQLNIFKNGSFESGLEGWETHTTTSGRKSIISIDKTVTHAGHPSLRIEQPDAADTWVAQEVIFKPQTHYRLSGWIKAKDVIKAKIAGAQEGGMGAILCLLGGYLYTEFVTNSDEWKYVSMDIYHASFKDPVKDPHRKVGPELGFYKKWVTGTAWFADVSLVEMGADNQPVRPTLPIAAVPGGNPPAPPVSDLAMLGSVVKANHRNLVFVSGANGAGSGFIAKLGVANYLITNAHVAAGVEGAVFKTLDGSTVPATAPVLAVDHDIFRMTLPPGGEPLKVMDHVDATAAIGDDVVVLGNAEAAGVVTPIKGRILGIGPNLVEVDAPFVPGNSGSPIIHLKTGEVIGVATYLVIRKYDPATDAPIKKPVIRRFGYRLDSVKSWQPVNWGTFAAQAAEMVSIEKLTEDLHNLLADIAKNHRVTPGLHTNPVIKRPIDLWLADSARHLSPSDKALADQSFLSRLKSACQNDISATRSQLTYDYFQRKLANEQRSRDNITEALDNILFAKAPAHRD